jgi:hypothetical protein
MKNFWKGLFRESEKTTVGVVTPEGIKKFVKGKLIPTKDIKIDKDQLREAFKSGRKPKLPK